MSDAAPPPPNPILNAYEQFVRETPLITRYVMTTLVVTWFASWLVDFSYATSTIPYFCLYRFEIYRIVISPFMCQNLLSLVFAYLSFNDNGKRLEHSLGSTAFGWYILTIALCTNIIFCAIMILLNGLTGEPGFLWYSSVGIWTIVFGLIATECSQAPRDSQRRLFFVNVPTIYFPLALWALFALLGGFDASDLISVGVGYAYGHGYLDKLKLSPARFHSWEETILANFTQRQGWVVGHAATGDNAWNSENASSGFNIFAPQRQQDASGSNTAVAPGRIAPPSDPAFPSSGGRALGSSSSTVKRGNSQTRKQEADARAAMLAAAEKRAEKRAQEKEEV